MKLSQWFGFLVIGLCVPAGAATLTLDANDTYIDSSQSGTPSGDYAHANYGHFGVIKAVVSTDPTQGFGISEVHSLFTLPQTFLSDAANGVSSAVVTWQVKNNTGLFAGTTIELHPLTHIFVAGTGGNPSLTKENGPPSPSPTAPNSPTPVGADWFTWNGADSTGWTPGGSYDAANVSLLGVQRVVGSNTYLDIDITNLIDNPQAYTEIAQYGLLMRLTQENDPSIKGNDFISLDSADSSSPPVITYTVPEPAALSLVGLATLTLRRKRQA